MKNISILFPTDFYNYKIIDEYYEFELDSLIKNTKFNYMLFNSDDFFMGNKFKLYNDNKLGGLVIYRGWMLKLNEYVKLYDKLKEYGYTLINNVIEYENCHKFPLSYDLIKEYTPKILTFNNYGGVDWNIVKNNFSKFLVKDYVKSVKDSRFPTYLDFNYSDDELDNYIDKFIEFRGDLFVKGIVLKEFVDLKKYDNKTNEYRCFFMNGKLLISYKNSNQSENTNELPLKFVNNLPILNSNFYTIDIAELENGEWTIIETGDGQVSGLPSELEANLFYKELGVVLA